MVIFVKRLLTWWHSQTLGTQLFTWRKGRRVGKDEQGNLFYQTADGKRRWVIYNGPIEASRITPEWHGWLHHTYEDPPNVVPLPRRAWEQPHVENLTGLPDAYAPPGSLRRARTGPETGYVPWTPPRGDD